MPRGYRCFIIAAGGWLTLTAADKPKEQPAIAGRTPSAESAPAEAQTTLYRPYPNQYADACYRAKNHDTADLCAQWRAAVAAEKSSHEARRATNWAIIATFFGFITVAGLIITIWQTFRALGEARRGNLIAQKANARATRQAIANAEDMRESLDISARNAAAAESSVLHAREESYLRLRAYVHAGETMLVENDSRSPLHMGTTRLVNYGQTPALKCGVNVSTRFLKPDDDLGAIVAGIPLIDRTHGRSIVQGRHAIGHIGPIDVAAFEQAAQGKIRIIIIARIEYDDAIRGDPHISQECWELQVKLGEMDKSGFCKMHHNFLHIPEFYIGT